MIKNQIWIKKYLPKNLNEFIGQTKQIEKIKRLFKLDKAILIYGPKGTGKTSFVYAYANEFNYEILEINASNSRNKKTIEPLLNSAINQQSLFFRKKIILIDEIDNLSNKDRGLISVIKKIIKSSKHKIIIIANEVTDKIKDLKKISATVEFNKLNTEEIYKKLENICKKENIKFDEKALKTLARSTDGDLRAAINDLQAFSTNNEFKEESLSMLLERDQKEKIEQALFKIFKTKNPQIARQAINSIDTDINEILDWIDYNIPFEYKNIDDLSRAMDYISISDVYNKRIKKWQYWRFLVYIYEFLSTGIALSKKQKYKSALEIKRSKKGLLIWQYNMKLGKKKTIAKKIAELTHTSTKQSFKNINIMMPLLKNIKNQIEFDDQEISWIEKNTA